MRLLLVLLLAMGIVAVACSDDGDDSSRDGPPPVEGTASVTDLGVGVIEVETGAGAGATAGARLEVHYTGYLIDGTQFDSSLDRNQTFSLRLNNGDVIAGWDDGLTGMAQGGVRRLIIPPELAYGDNGFGDTIPPGAQLTFDIELVSLTQCPPPPEDAPPSVEGESFTTESGMEVIIIVGGEDADPIANDDVASVHYTGWLEADGTRFDSSLERCEPFTFQLGAGGVIKGWDEGVLGMSPGDIRRLIIPADLAYGDDGSGSIPPGATLIFDVELVGFGRATE